MNISPEDAERIVINALSNCATTTLNELHTEDERRAVLDDDFIQLDFDSLACMELCIAIHCECGVELSIEDLARLGSPRAVTRHLAQQP